MNEKSEFTEQRQGGEFVIIRYNFPRERGSCLRAFGSRVNTTHDWQVITTINFIGHLKGFHFITKYPERIKSV